MWFGGTNACYGCRSGVMRCNLFAIKNQMFKCGDVWDRQYRGLNGAGVINGKDTPLGQWSRPY